MNRIDRMQSLILDGQEVDYYYKLKTFIILLDENKLQKAQKLLQDFENQSYHQSLVNIWNVTREYNVTAYPQLKSDYVELQKQYQMAQNKLKRFSAQKQPNYQQLQKNINDILDHIQNEKIQSALALANINSIPVFKDILTQVKEYRWLKRKSFPNSLTRSIDQNAKQIQFTSTEGQALKRLIKTQVDIIKQVNDFFLAQMENIKCNRPPKSELPRHIFYEPAIKLHQGLLAHFREIRTKIQVREEELRDKIKGFMKQFQLENDDSLVHQEQIIDNFLEKVKNQLNRKKKIASLLKQKSKKQNLTPILRSQQFEQINKNLLLSMPNIEQSSNPIKFKRSPRKVQTKPSANLTKFIIPINDIKNIRDQLKHTLSLTPFPVQQIQYLNINDELYQINKKFRKSINYYQEKLEQNKKGVDKDQIQLINQVTPAQQQIKVPNVSLINESIEQKTQKTRTSSANETYIQNQKEIAELKNQYKQLIDQNSFLQAKLSLKQQQFKKMQQKIYSNKSSLSTNVNSEAINLALSISKNEDQFSNCKQVIARQQILLEQKQNQINSLKTRRSSQIQEIKQKYEEKLSKQKIRYRKLAQEIDQLTEKIEKVNNMYLEKIEYQQIRGPEIKRQGYQSQNQLLINSVRMKKDDSEFQIEEREGDQDSEFFIDSFRLEQSTIRVRPSELQDQRNILQQQIKNLEFQLQFHKNHYEQLQAYHNTIISKKDKEIKDLEEIAQSLRKQRDQLRRKIQTFQIRQITHNEINQQNLHLFPAGGIFEQYNFQERLFLIERLTDRLGKIKLTRLIYRTDNYNKTNFHRYIDGYRNIVVIVKTLYGKMIAGFSSEAFNSKGITPGYGMILSLWKKKIYELRDKKAITYDDYYLIFGNSELRLRSMEFKLFSNFGISNSFYNNRGDKVHELLGQDQERDVNISGFEVYALQLDD